MPPPSSTVAQMEFTSRIRKRRSELGIDAKTVSQRLGFSRNFWSAVENNRSNLSREKFLTLAELFDLSEDETSELDEVLAASKASGWWSDYSSVSSEEMRRFCGLEFGSQSIFVYESQIVTGLLQTESYARAVIAADPKAAPATVRQLVDLRMRRQERLVGDDPPRLTVVLSQAALMQQVGSRAVLRDQVGHLLQVSDSLSDVLDIRIQPFDESLPGLANASVVVLLEFESPHVSTVAWREAGSTLGIADEPELVELLQLGFNQVLESSLSRDASRALMRERLQELDQI